MSSIRNWIDSNKNFAVALLITFLFVAWSYFSCFNFIDSHHAGLAYNRVSGETWIQPPGGHFTTPWTAVSRIDVRPQRLCIQSAARSSKCLLVQFKKEAFMDLTKAEGFRYYWWDNRISFNLGHAEEYRGFNDLMMGYAYTQASFLTIQEEY